MVSTKHLSGRLKRLEEQEATLWHAQIDVALDRVGVDAAAAKLAELALAPHPPAESLTACSDGEKRQWLAQTRQMAGQASPQQDREFRQWIKEVAGDIETPD